MSPGDHEAELSKDGDGYVKRFHLKQIIHSTIRNIFQSGKDTNYSYSVAATIFSHFGEQFSYLT